MKLAIAITTATFAIALAQPAPELLWPNGAPLAQGTEDIDKPSLTPYLVDAVANTGTAVVVCPGGGYQHLAMDHEGKQIAEFLNKQGVNAFVLKYRLGPKYHHPVQMTDVQRAIRTVRSRAQSLNIRPDRIGVWGFSAGGHLASTAATHFDAGNATAADPIDRLSSRPDFAILAYPVITFITPSVHSGSRENLLGKNYDPKLAEFLSNETQVGPDTPPVFLFHTTDDSTVPVENAILFYNAMRKAKRPVEMHIFEHGRHGVGLAQNDPVLSEWATLLTNWLRARGLLQK